MRRLRLIIRTVLILTAIMCMTKALAADTGRLALDVSPEPAEVFIGGTKYANGSGVFKLDAGEHEVVVKKSGYVTQMLKVFIGPDAIVTKSVVLEPKASAKKKAAPGGFEKTPLVKVPEGFFRRGSNDYDEEKPPHDVYLDEFFIEKYEVSVAQFVAFLNAKCQGDTAAAEKYVGVNDSDGTIMYAKGRFMARSGFENRPVNEVSWFGADAYCKWIGRRLPTEAEWEKAARGTDGRKYPWGNNDPGNNHNLAVYDYKDHDDKFSDMKPVDSLPEGASPYGAHHMAGNVWEWVADWYDGDYCQKNVIENPKGPASEILRVLRGGSWGRDAHSIRAAYRDNGTPGNRDYNVGCRCAQ